MKLLIFDCDGTLVDSQHMIVAAMTDAFLSEGFAVPSRDRIVGVVGLSLPLAIAHLVPPDCEFARVERLAHAYKEAFRTRRLGPDHAEPLYAGVREMLARLASREGVMLAMATGKSRRGVDAVLEREGIAEHFVTIQTADTHPSKPHPSMILAALGATGAEVTNAAMIGDTTFDIEMAHAAGVAALGVGWGYHAPDALLGAGARRVATDCAELESALEHLMLAAEKAP